LVALVSTPALALSAGKLYVNSTTGSNTTNGNPNSCRLLANPCATISYALTLAPPDATILVASGSYDEQLTITQNVTIDGAGAAGAGATIIDPVAPVLADTDTDSSTPQNYIVDVTSGAVANLKFLAVDGSAGSSFFTGCSADYVGVYFHDAGGTLNNVDVDNLQLPTAFQGCQDGLGVYVASDSGSTSNVTMSTVSVQNYDKNGITCDDAGTTCTISHTSVQGVGPTGVIAQNGIQVYGAAAATLSKDDVSQNTYTGGDTLATGLLLYDVGTLNVASTTAFMNDDDILAGQDASGSGDGTWTFSKDVLDQATDDTSSPSVGQGLGDGLALDSTTNVVTISGLKTFNNYEYGIALYGVSNATVTKSKTGDNADGIYVGGPGGTATTSTGNTISSNIVTTNTVDGILADTDSTGNTFLSNKLRNNVFYDLADLGTGNIWTTNSCTPAHDSNPAGLC